MSNRFWLLTRVLALIAFIGFIAVGIIFASYPQLLTGYGVGGESSLWHALAIAFMATVSTLALMILYDPKRFWHMLIPLAAGKAVSSIYSLYWYRIYTVNYLMTNSLVDGSIAIISILLSVYIYIKYSSTP